MRLICGLISLNGAPVDPLLLERMTAALTAPGLSPGIDRFHGNAVTMAVLNFASANGSASLARQNDGDFLVADMRLDRSAELATTLSLPTHSSGKELISAAIARWGEDLPARVDGDFALAAWDANAQQLLCARDIMGVRPLCYVHHPGELFAFASLPKGLHGSGVVPLRFDPIALGRLLVEYYSFDALTGFQDIAWLRPGHTLIVSRKGLRLHRAWRPDKAEVGRWRGTAKEAAAILRDLVQQAVASRLQSSGAIASHLSGGLDSSAISVIAARSLRIQGRTLHAFSQLAEPQPGPALLDERAYVDAVLAQEPDIIWSPGYLSCLASQSTFDVDLQMLGATQSADDGICRAAAAAGAHILLSGAGGDESTTYNGRALYAALLLRAHWADLYRELRARASRDKQGMGRAVVRHLVAPLLPEWALRLRRRISHRPSALDEIHTPLAFLLPQLRGKVISALSSMPKLSNRSTDRIWLLTDSYVNGRTTRWSLLGARHGIAFSFPLLDRRVIEFALSLPVQRFLSGGYARQPFRDAMAGILPESIRWRESKFSSFPDMPIRLAAAKPELLTQIKTLASYPKVSEILDLDKMMTAVRNAPNEIEAERIAAEINRSASDIPSNLRDAMNAIRALNIAQSVARFS